MNPVIKDMACQREPLGIGMRSNQRTAGPCYVNAAERLPLNHCSTATGKPGTAKVPAESRPQICDLAKHRAEARTPSVQPLNPVAAARSLMPGSAGGPARGLAAGCVMSAAVRRGG
jgi:hypothetical protein